MERRDFFSLPHIYSKIGLWLNSFARRTCFPLWVSLAAGMLPVYENCEFIQQMKVSPCEAEFSNEMWIAKE